LTIAAGFVCQDGVVLCADTEITTWQSKSHESKIDFVEFSGGKAAFTYAGHVRFANCAIQKCKGRLVTGGAANMLEDIESILDQEYRRNVLSHPDQATNGSLHYEVLIGLVSEHDRARLYVSSQTAIQEVTSWVPIGIGCDLARHLIQHGPYNVAGAVKVAAYALSEIKDSVPGCGGMSIYMILQNDGRHGVVTSIHDGPCKELQDFARAYDFVTRELLMQLANEDATDEHCEQYLREVFTGRIMEKRRQWSADWRRREKAFLDLNPHLDATDAKRMHRELSLGIVPAPAPKQEGSAA
jgi:hypothetical protein